MAKRKTDALDTNSEKKHKTEHSLKRKHEQVAQEGTKRHKTYEYWHMAPLNREQRAAHMAVIYERIICK